MFYISLLLDEFVYILSNYRLIDYRDDRVILHKYMLMLNECNVSKSSQRCVSLCKEFNINKFSYMFDGEGRFVKDFLMKFNKIFNYITKKSEYNKLF